MFQYYLAYAYGLTVPNDSVQVRKKETILIVISIAFFFTFTLVFSNRPTLKTCDTHKLLEAYSPAPDANRTCFFFGFNTLQDLSTLISRKFANSGGVHELTS